MKHVFSKPLITASLLGLILVLTGCDVYPPNTGYYNQITIFCSEADRNLIEHTVEDLFGEIIMTPQEERVFNLEWVDAVDIKDYRDRKNLLVIAVDNPPDETGDVLFQKFADAAGQNNPVMSAKEIFARDQLFVGIHAADNIDFQIQVDTNREWLLSEFTESYENNLMDYVKSKGLDRELIRKIREDFGVDMTIQKDFMIIREEPEKDFLWIGRTYPYRWLLFNRDDAAAYDNPDSSWTSLAGLFSETLDGVELYPEYHNQFLIQGENQVFRVIRGLYGHDESESGGPFVSYIVQAPDADQVLVISGFVNHPGHEKMFVLKQLEVMIKNLKLY